MTADEVLAAYQAAMVEAGETISVRRYSGSPRTHVDTTTVARVVGYMPQELVGSIVQGDRKVIALVDSLSSILPVVKSDALVIRGKEVAIKGVDDNSRRVEGTLIALEIQASG